MKFCDQLLNFTSVAVKNWSLSTGYFGNWGHALLAVAVVKRFKQESMYGHCREMTVSQGLIVVLPCLPCFFVESI